jgi:hypothetical protein
MSVLSQKNLSVCTPKINFKNTYVYTHTHPKQTKPTYIHTHLSTYTLQYTTQLKRNNFQKRKKNYLFNFLLSLSFRLLFFFFSFFLSCTN